MTTDLPVAKSGGSCSALSAYDAPEVLSTSNPLLPWYSVFSLATLSGFSSASPTAPCQPPFLVLLDLFLLACSGTQAADLLFFPSPFPSSVILPSLPFKMYAEADLPWTCSSASLLHSRLVYPHVSEEACPVLLALHVLQSTCCHWQAVAVLARWWLSSLCPPLEWKLHKGGLLFPAVAAAPGRVDVLGCVIQWRLIIHCYHTLMALQPFINGPGLGNL